jgi:multimeric flavodoxin WrbA
MMRSSARDGANTVIFHLRDINIEVVEAWGHHFKDIDEVKISVGDIFELTANVDAIVSPANSFGYMDGGIDRVYLDRFGWELQDRLQLTSERNTMASCRSAKRR